MTSESLATQLKPLVNNRPRSKPASMQVVARLEEGDGFVAGSWVEFRVPENIVRPSFNGSVHLFSQLREAVRRASGDYTWAIRYASQVTRENMPFLHSSQTKTILFDPFMPFRDLTREFSSSRVLVWQIFPSNAYYFKTQAEAKSVTAQLTMLNSLCEGEKS